MHSSKRLEWIAVAALILSPAVHGATILSFDSLPDGTMVTNQFSGQGVLFTNAIALTAGLSLNEFEFPPRSGTGAIGDDSGGLILDFAAGVSAVTGYFTYGQALTMTALDAGDNVLASVVSAFQSNAALSGDAGSSPNEMLTIVLGSAAIRKVVVQGSVNGGSFTLDDLTFEASGTEVPEPSTLWVGFGLVAIACVRRARRLSILAAALSALVYPAALEPPVMNPASLLPATPTQVTVSARLVRQPTEPNAVPNGVNVTRVASDGSATVLGILNDSGTNGDAVAGDDTYSAIITLTATETVLLRVTAALQGVRTRIQSPIGVLPVSGSAGTAQVTVRVVEADYTNPPTYEGPSAGAGVEIQVNGAARGVTDSEGRQVLTLAAGGYDLAAVVPGRALGQAYLEVAAGEQTTVTLVLDEEKEVYSTTRLTVDEVSEQGFPSTAPWVTLRCWKGNSPLPVKILGTVAILGTDGQFLASVEEKFVIQADGSIRAPSSVLALNLDPAQRVVGIELTMLGSDDATYAGSTAFAYGRFRLSGILVPPPSRPSLAVARLPVSIKVLQSSIDFVVTTDSDGRFSSATPLPVGLLEVSAMTTEGGRFYTGLAQFVLDQHQTVRLNMLTDVDLQAGVPPYVLGGPVTLLSLEAAPSRLEREALERVLGPAPPRGSMKRAPARVEERIRATMTMPSALSAEATATSGPAAVPVSATATLAVPKGSKTVTLRYEICSEEYPHYVMRQSIFNDVWSLAVRVAGTGARLFDLSRNVNSQISLIPIWRPWSPPAQAGCTGEFTRDFNVESLTSLGDIAISVYLSATNIVDDIALTSVRANLSTEAPPITIEEVTLQDRWMDQPAEKPSPNPYIAELTLPKVSLPRAGQRNVRPRVFRLKVKKPAGAQIEWVSAKMQYMIGSTEALIVNQALPGSAAVKSVGAELVDVTVSYHQKAAELSLTMPPWGPAQYSFQVGVRLSGTLLTSPWRSSENMQVLYRMPDGIPRYSPTDSNREPGGDDWSAWQTYYWIDQYRGLLTRVNDISGEHARTSATRARTGEERTLTCSTFTRFRAATGAVERIRTSSRGRSGSRCGPTMPPRSPMCRHG